MDIALDRLRSSLAQAEVCVPEVSRWSIGMHVHHCCLAMLGIASLLEKSTPPPPRQRRSLLASIMFRVGRIPRGSAEAIEVVLPREGISAEELAAQMDQCDQTLARVRELDTQSWFKHFAFGVLNRDQALRFMGIHNRHHLRIIEDIAGRR